MIQLNHAVKMRDLCSAHVEDLLLRKITEPSDRVEEVLESAEKMLEYWRMVLDDILEERD